jgi:uncharacterized coiled-coil protein SlyX
MGWCRALLDPDPDAGGGGATGDGGAVGDVPPPDGDDPAGDADDESDDPEPEPEPKPVAKKKKPTAPKVDPKRLAELEDKAHKYDEAERRRQEARDKEIEKLAKDDPVKALDRLRTTSAERQRKLESQVAAKDQQIKNLSDKLAARELAAAVAAAREHALEQLKLQRKPGSDKYLDSALLEALEVVPDPDADDGDIRFVVRGRDTEDDIRTIATNLFKDEHFQLFFEPSSANVGGTHRRAPAPASNPGNFAVTGEQYKARRAAAGKEGHADPVGLRRTS